VSAVVLSASPEHAQLVLQVRDPLQQRGAVGLGLLVGLPSGLLHLPLVPALHLRRHRLEEVLRHLLGVVPLLSKRGSVGPVLKDLQSPDPRGPPGLGPALLLVAPPSVPPPLPVPGPGGGGFGSAAAAALYGRRQAAGSLVPAPSRAAVVQVRQVLVLPLGVSADPGTLLGPNHLDRRRGDPGGRRSGDIIIVSLIAV